MNDGTDACCDGTCTNACGGYGKTLEGTRPIWTWFDETHHSDGTEERRVVFLGQPGAGKSEFAGRCGERCDGTEELVFEGELSGFVGMMHGGRADLARRAKDIAGGRPVEDTP